MPFEPFGEAARFGRRKGFVERSGLVGAEIILHQHDLRRVGKMRVGQVLERVGIIDGGVTIGHFHMPPALQRREHHEQIGHAVALVFVIVTRLASGLGGYRFARFDDHLLRGFVEADDGALRIAWPLIDLQHVFHVGHKGRTGLGRNDPLLLQMRLESVFLRVRPMVLSLARSTMCSSTTFSSSRRRLHLACPSGAGPHASVINFASATPSKIRGRAEFGLYLRVSTARRDSDSFQIRRTLRMGVVNLIDSATTDELLATVNAQAAQLGIQPVTQRWLRFLVDENLIEARTPKGRQRGLNPTWRFSESATRHACTILELKSRGVQRTASIRIQLWVLDEHYPMDGVHEALCSEFARLLKRIRRASRFDYDHRRRAQPSDAEMQRHAKKLPPLDTDLSAAGFTLPKQMMVELASELNWGTDGYERLSCALNKLAQQANISADILNFGPGLANLGGLFGNSDEIINSGEEIIKRVCDDDLCKARLRVKQQTLIFDFLKMCFPNDRAIGKIIMSLQNTDWIVSNIVVFAVQFFRERTEDLK
jgi:hypothetical protein